MNQDSKKTKAARQKLQRRSTRFHNRLIREDVLPLETANYFKGSSVLLTGQEVEIALIELGFKFGDKVCAKLRAGTLPHGWSKKNGGRGRPLTYLIDSSKKNRAFIFDEHLPHNRSKPSKLYLNRRFRPAGFFNTDTQDRWYTAIADDAYGDKRVYKKIYLSPIEAREVEAWIAAGSKQNGISFTGPAVKWLEKNMPDWSNPLAYWDMD